jgi:hypothetical protein
MYMMCGMKAFPALRALACASLLSLIGTTTASAQLYTSSREFTVVATTNPPQVFSAENSGVAVKALFEFDDVDGFLQITLTNLAGTPKPGGGEYTNGILVGFGFDGLSAFSYVNGSYKQLGYTLGEPGGVDFTLGNGFSMSGSLGAPGNGSFDYGAGVDGANGNGGGNGDSGIAAAGITAGYSAVFEYKFTGNMVDFDAYGFFDHNGADADFGFRYRSVGPNGSDSEKFVYIVETPPIPEPSTYGLVAASLLVGLVTVKRMRARKAVAV